MLHTGGTLMMRGGDLTPLRPDVYTSDLLTELPVLDRIADIETRILFNLDSSDMQPHHWVELAAAVHGALEERLPGGGLAFDGVVVLHGTDTMAYTAGALAFLLPGLDRPVVFTGAQRPLAEVRTDARSNLVDACHLATMDIPEVGIAFNARLFRGCRAKKVDAWGLAAFDSPTCPPLVTLGVTVERGAHILPARSRAAFDPRIEAKVLAVRVFPGLDPSLLLGALRVGVRGLLLEGFGSGNLPRLENSLIPVIEAALARDVPVVIVSQCMRGAVDLSRYEGGSAAQGAGAISAGTMTAQAALAKLMIALGRAGEGRRLDAAKRAFAETWAGEV
jgi:L-asparaginase